MTSLSSRLNSNQRFEFTSDAYSADTFAVVRMQGHEAVSQLYRFELVLVSDDAQIDLERMLQQNATLQILAPNDPQKRTPYSGMLAEFDQLQHASGYTFYRAVLVPRAWRLTLSRTSEVYLNEQTIPQTIEKLLRDAQLSGQDVSFKLTGKYRPRSYVCQYQESHFDFISRWMEKEGMYYYFAQNGRSDTLEIVDDKAMHAADAVAVNYRPADELDTGLAPDSVQGFVCQQRPLPKQVVLQDYNYRKASLPLVVQAPVSSSGVGEAMFYGDNFRDAAEGQRYANLRAQELLCGARVFAGEATAVGLRSGYFMQISHHYRDDFNGRYLVTEISHEGSQAGALLAGIKTPFGARENLPGQEIVYRNTFRAIPADVQFRAARTTPKPRVAGTMNATIDAEGSGQYAEIDQYGQYKVQLPFDRTDKPADKGSARVRFATPYSGEGHGMHFPLHKSAEVLLSFVDGDPDQPIIVGAVPNSVNANVVTHENPHQNRLSTRGGHQIVMDDTAGNELMWLHSPASTTSLMLGKSKTAVDPGPAAPTSGWHMLTLGASNTFAMGVTNRFSLGPANSVYATGDTNVSGTYSNKIVLGSQMLTSIGTNVNWSYATNLVMNGGTGLQISDSAQQQASTSMVLTAGKDAVAGAAIAALSRTMAVLKGSFIAMGAINAGLGAATSGVLAGFDVKASTSPESYATSDPENFATNIGATGIALASNAALVTTIAITLNKLAKAYKALQLVSTIKLDNTGITLDASFPPAVPLDEATLKLSRSEARLTKSHNAGAGTVEIGDDKASMRFLDATGSTDFDISGAQASITSSVGPTFKVSQTEIEGMVGAQNGFLLDTNGFTVVAGPGMLKVEANTASMSIGAANVTVQPTGASITFAAANVNLAGTGAVLNGPLIQLG